MLGECYPQHTNVEFLAFLKLVARQYPEGDLHIVMDNYGTHTHPNVLAWLDKPANKRITLHFTSPDVPGSTSSRCSSRSSPEKRSAEFVWTKPADVIITKATGKRRTTFIKDEVEAVQPEESNS